HAEGDRLRDDVGEFDLKDVARCSTLDQNRPGQRVYRAGIERWKIRDRCLWLDLAVECVSRFQRHFFTFADFDDRRDVRVKAVVAQVGLMGEPLRPVDADRMHQLPPINPITSSVLLTSAKRRSMVRNSASCASRETSATASFTRIIL